MTDAIELFPLRRRTIRNLTLSQFQPNMRRDGHQLLYSGVVRCIAQHPTDEAEFTVASQMGGLFRSNDGGSTWRHLDDLPYNFTNSVAYDINDPSILLATTHEDYLNPPTGGVWRSTDGGETWRQPESGRLHSGMRCTGRLSAFKIAFDPSRGGRVYVATNCGILISEDSGANWQSPVVPEDMPGRGDPRFTAVIVLRGSDVYAGGITGIWFSSDYGQHWTRSLTGESMFENDMNGFGVSPISSSQLFVVTQVLGTSIPDAHLFEFGGGGGWTRLDTPPPPGAGAGGTAFVKAIRTPESEVPDDGSGRQWLRLYYGNRLTIFRKDAASMPGGSSVSDFSGSWEEEIPCHADTHDLIFDRWGRPILSATDGGLETRTGPSPLCPPESQWELIGGVQNGLSALQITDLAGQQILDTAGEFLRQDLYFSTIHNSIWASTNNGSTWDKNEYPEGGGLEMYPRIEEDRSVVTFSRCAPCWNVKAVAGLTELVMWHGPSETAYGTPVLVPRTADGVGAGNYIQHGYTGTITNRGLFLSRDNGSTWSIVVSVSEGFAGPPHVAGSEDPVVYQGIRIPGTPPEYRLLRISSLFSTVPIKDYPAMDFKDPCTSGVASSQRVNLAYFGKDYDWHPVFAIDPHNPNHLIGVDLNSHKVVESFDGGYCWQPMEALTELVTTHGQYRLDLGPVWGDDGKRMSLVTLISFNPASPEQIIIGTEQNGIFFSNDAGRTWETVPNSWQVTSAISAYWQSDDTIVVGSYGRGLWKIQLTMRARLEPIIDLCELIQCFVIDLNTLTPGSLADASFDEAIILYNGRVMDVELIGDQVKVIQTTPGSSHIFATSDSQPITLNRSLVKQEMHISQQPQWEPLRQLDSKLRVVGLLLEYGKVKYILAADHQITPDPLPQTPLKAVTGNISEDNSEKPSLSLFGGTMLMGYPIFTEIGEELAITGSGFDPGIPVVLYLDNQDVLAQVSVDKSGLFQHRVPVHLPIGKHTILARQRVDKERFNSDADFFIVKHKDDFD